MDPKPLDKKVWLSTPTMHGDELKYMTEAYQTNWMSAFGQNVTEVERLTREYVGCKHAVALSSGTAALHLAVRLAGIRPGDIVFCSDVTFVASANPILYEGAVPVFIDIEYDTWNMDPKALENAFRLYPDTKAVIVVNLYGTPAKLDEIKAICDKNGAVLIEDAAESLGAVYKGIQSGTFGKYNAISFNGNKIITGSSGGMLMTDDSEAASLAGKWSMQSREKTLWYQHEELGYNYRMSNVVAGVVRGQYRYLDEHIAQKKAIYMRYKEGLSGLPVSMNPYIEDIMEPNFWLSCLLIDENAMCRQVIGDSQTVYIKEQGKSHPNEILEKLDKYNAEGRPIWKPMSMQPLYINNTLVTAEYKGEAQSDKCISGKKEIGVGADIFQRGLCLPSDIKMTKAQQDTIIEVIRSCF